MLIIGSQSFFATEPFDIIYNLMELSFKLMYIIYKNKTDSFFLQYTCCQLEYIILMR